MTTAQHPERYRPEPSGRFAVNLTAAQGADPSAAQDPAQDPARDAAVAPSGTGAHAPEPKAAPRARWWTVLLGLVLLAATAVIVRDILVLNGSVSGRQLLPPVFEWFATVHSESWMLWAGIGCSVAALFFLIVSVRPRRRTHIAFGGGSQLYARPVDVARFSTAAARRVPGVLSARTVMTRRKILVKVVAGVPESAETVRSQVTAHVSELADLLEPAPGTGVTVTPGGDGR